MEIKLFESIEAIGPRNWEKVAPPEFPFAGYEFLVALEKNQCLGARTGWAPLYFTSWQGADLQAAIPFFVKNNSYGEYIFDFVWAQAYKNSGLQYYPKLTSAIPFTSATGPKLLFSALVSESQKAELAHQLLQSTAELCEKYKIGTSHALFITAEEAPRFQSEGFQIRHSFQYHWANSGFKTFDDYLATLKSKRRTEVKRERRQSLGSGLRISRLTGEDLKPHHAEAMFEFYKNTTIKKGGHLYLTPGFFKQVFETMKRQILFVVAANQQGESIAGALNFFGPTKLFGRYWGAIEDHKSLHLELCYYQGIEFAIEKGLAVFEAGAQGEHKFQRGFVPQLTYSAHKFKHTELSEAIGRFIEDEKIQIAALFRDYELHSPFCQK